MPDGCVDVVLHAGQLMVAGPATVAMQVPAAPGHGSCGVRFRVGAAGAALGVPADSLRDQSVPLATLWGAEGRRLSDAVSDASDPTAALRLLMGGLAEPREPLDRAARRAAVLAVGRPFHEVSRELGFSERHLRRRMERAVGYGPRTLGRVIRLQRFFQACERCRSASLAELAAEAGYADQAHLARDCRRLTGRTPSALRAAGASAAGERTSEAFKTAAPRSTTLVP
jgi:AraC-like DNA-binding protein